MYLPPSLWIAYWTSYSLSSMLFIFCKLFLHETICREGISSPIRSYISCSRGFTRRASRSPASVRWICLLRRSVGSSRRSTQPFFSRLLIRLVRQALSLAVCSARYYWLTPGFFHRRCITWSISNVMSTLLVFNTLCMVWRKVIRVFRIWSISSCAVSLFAIAVYFYGTKIRNILEISVRCLTVGQRMRRSNSSSIFTRSKENVLSCVWIYSKSVLAFCNIACSSSG